jgi:hypothetical protein
MEHPEYEIRHNAALAYGPGSYSVVRKSDGAVVDHGNTEGVCRAWIDKQPLPAKKTGA